jgi:hypothetical protein
MRFYKVILFIVLFYIINICISGSCFACQPCRTKLNFKDTVKRADLIIIGKKIADQGRKLRGFREKGITEGKKIKIFRVLKGITNKDIINVRCLYGMCGYGICINDDKLYMIFLSAPKSDGNGYNYTSVNSGCAVKYYEVVGNSIVLNGVSVPMSQFEKILSGK